MLVLFFETAYAFRVIAFVPPCIKGQSKFQAIPHDQSNDREIKESTFSKKGRVNIEKYALAYLYCCADVLEEPIALVND